ncbi:MAG: hypothetical protein LQ351_001903 [Letrouitia transgressa]|nr:MAG: hypothetical protein LQ351_001903 [Letrouitia transgressa]
MSASSQDSGDTVQAGDEDLTEEQIDALLGEAEQRLTAAGSSFSPPSIHSIARLKPKHPAFSRPYLWTINQIAHVDPSRMVDKKQREVSARSVAPKPAAKKREAQTDAGPQWFYMPTTDPSLKRDIQLLKLRGVIDPKRHYKQEPKKSSLPRFAQQGTVIEGPTDYFSARIPNKERRKNFIEEVLAQEQETGYFKEKYEEIQEKRTSGKKGYYNALKKKRARQRR